MIRKCLKSASVARSNPSMVVKTWWSAVDDMLNLIDGQALEVSRSLSLELNRTESQRIGEEKPLRGRSGRNECRLQAVDVLA